MTNKTDDTKRILVALDLTHQSGREHLAGFYSFADKKSNWEIRLVPSTEPSYLPMVERFLSEGVDGAIIKGGRFGDIPRERPVLQGFCAPRRRSHRQKQICQQCRHRHVHLRSGAKPNRLAVLG